MSSDVWIQAGHKHWSPGVCVSIQPQPPTLLALSRFGKYVSLRHLLKLSETDTDGLTLQVR